jgi:hypothetical protein
MRKWIFGLLVVVILALAAAGCESDADKVNKNLGKACEQFECQRRIVGVNGITDKVEFVVEGRCSIEGAPLGGLRALTVTCKQGPHEFKKHFVGMSDNMFFISTQLESLDASVSHTRIILKPQNVVPDFDLVTGG